MEVNLESAIRRGVEKALNTPIVGGKTVTEWAAIGMKAPQWISVEDRLPGRDGEYVVYGQTEAMRELLPDAEPIWICNYYKQYGFYHLELRREYGFITHWMPLPEPPKEV